MAVNPSSPDVTFTYNEVNKVNTLATVGLGTITFLVQLRGFWRVPGCHIGDHIV